MGSTPADAAILGSPVIECDIVGCEPPVLGDFDALARALKDEYKSSERVVMSKAAEGLMFPKPTPRPKGHRKTRVASPGPRRKTGAPPRADHSSLAENGGPAAAGLLPKQRRQTCLEFLAWVRTERCLVHGGIICCDPPNLDEARGGKVETAHLDSVGSRGSDYSAVPLCHEAHMELHRIGEESFSTRHGIDLRLESWRLTVRWFTGRKP